MRQGAKGTFSFLNDPFLRPMVVSFHTPPTIFLHLKHKLSLALGTRDLAPGHFSHLPPGGPAGLLVFQQEFLLLQAWGQSLLGVPREQLQALSVTETLKCV